MRMIVARLAAPGSPRLRRAVLWFVSAATLATAGVRFGGGLIRPPAARSPEWQALVDAVGADWRIEPRLAGGFAYGPLGSSARSAGISATTSVDLRLAAARIDKALADRRTTRNLHDAGIAYLVTGEIDKAVAALEDASRDAANEPTLASDLAAAYLVRGTQTGRHEDIAKAASQAEKATHARPSFAEAVFNRGLAFEALSLRRDALDTWQRYLELDSRTPWADEARQHLRALVNRSAAAWEKALLPLGDPRRCRDAAAVAAAVDASPVRTRDYFEDELLPSWGDAYAAGAREDAAGRLACARALAETFARDGDLMALDAVNAIQAASQRSAGRALMLAKAHQMFREGRRLFESGRLREAESVFHEVSRRLRQSASRFDVEAAFFAARSAYRQQRIDEALAALTRLIDDATGRAYWYLLARLHRLRGVIEDEQSKFAGVLEDYRIASSNYERIHDAENAAGVHTLLAVHLQTLGEPRESWTHLFQALASLPLMSSPVQRYQILRAAIERCLHDDLPDVALHFQNAQLENTRTWPGAVAAGTATDAYLHRARALLRLGDMAAAEQDVSEARRLLADVRDPDLSERWRAEILLTEAESWQNARPADATGALTAALSTFERAGLTLRLPYLFLLLGRARLAAGNIDEAQADLQRGIDAFERQHRTVNNPQSRVSHFDESWDVFADMIRLQLRQRKRPDLALAYAERGRARTLLEAVTRRTDLSVPASDVSTLQRRIPRNVTVLSFATLKDELVAWIITDHSTDVVQQSIALSALEAKASALRAAVAGPKGPRERELLADLYDVLIRPFGARLDPSAAALVIVPDGPLSSVPFAALIDRRTNRHLIEDRAVGMAPSLAVFVEMSERLRTKAAVTMPKLLVVGAPSINRSVYPNLADLEGARAEAMEIAGLYRGAELLSGENATKARFLESIRGSDVAHFAGHAVANQEFPWLSRLLFAPGSEPGSDTLFSQELAGERLDRLRLVVLAACSTGVGAGVRGEGALSLARAFLAAGTPTVVASLWDVSDAASQHLFGTFYTRLRSGAPPLYALREAQLAALHSGDAPQHRAANWSAFAAIGGFSWSVQ